MLPKDLFIYEIFKSFFYIPFGITFHSFPLKLIYNAY